MNKWLRDLRVLEYETNYKLNTDSSETSPERTALFSPRFIQIINVVVCVENQYSTLISVQFRWFSLKCAALKCIGKSYALDSISHNLQLFRYYMIRFSTPRDSTSKMSRTWCYDQLLLRKAISDLNLLFPTITLCLQQNIHILVYCGVSVCFQITHIDTTSLLSLVTDQS